MDRGRNLGNFKQDIHHTAKIAQGAVIVGNVTIEEECSIWYNAVIRGDVGTIRIGRKSNIQDCCVIHTNWEIETMLGEGVTVGHGAILHGCKIGDYTLVGMGAIIMDDAEIGKNCIIGAGTLITQGKKIPEGSMVIGNPGIIKRQLKQDEIADLERFALDYCKIAQEIIIH
jgi:carbonic anhydrase/acetyltransferase-like protein (isoleucine patch superfamily)